MKSEQLGYVMEELVREVTPEEIKEYRDTGVVRLQGILSQDWVDLLGASLDKAFYEYADRAPVFYDSTALAEQMAQAGVAILGDARAAAMTTRGRFLSIIGGWTVNDGIRRVALESPLACIAGQLFGSQKVNYYDDQLLTKEPGTREYTAFHTDEPYYHLRGDQVCGMWVSPDSVSEDSGAMQYVRGSHKWGSFFKPNAFVSQQSLGSLGAGVDDENQIPLPDIEGNRDDYDIVTHPSEPGDVIVHHSRLIHGSGPNYSDNQHRRAASFRYAGDDVSYWYHPSAPPQPHHQHQLNDGEPIDCDQFPVVWRAG